MLRSDFDNAQLWADLDRVDQQLTDIRDQHVIEELPDLERIAFQLDYVRSYRQVAAEFVSFFTPAMLEVVRVNSWTEVQNHLANRIAVGPGAGYVAAAAVSAENGLMQMGPWPRKYGKGGQVQQMATLFEDLLERQRLSVSALAARHEQLQTEVATAIQTVSDRRDEVELAVSGLKDTADAIKLEVDGQKDIVLTATTEATKAVSALTLANDKAFKEWSVKTAAELEATFAPTREAIAKHLEDATKEYAALLAKKEEYSKLVGAIAATEIASDFSKEAKSGRRTGLWLYGIAIFLLGAAAVPLIWLLFDSVRGSATVLWQVIAIRISIAALAATAATVLIRLGSRFITNANAAKRMELELRAVGPFLANVADPNLVDGAKVSMVEKAFGKTYVMDSKVKDDGTDAVGSITSLLELMLKFRN